MGMMSLASWSLLSIPCPRCRRNGCTFVPSVPGKIFRVASCPCCAYLFTWPRQSKADLLHYYSTRYAEPNQENHVGTPPSREAIFQEPYLRLLGSRRDLSLILERMKSGRILEVGCAWGGFLYTLQTNGFEVAGVDVSTPNIRFAREVLGLEAFPGELKEANWPDDWFDLVFCSHTLEHTLAPWEVITEAWRVLKPGGAFVVLVPNFSAWLREKLGKKWAWISPRDHYTHFTPELLSEMLREAGFDLIFLESEEGHYGEETLLQFCSAQEMKKLHRELRGSELIAVASKGATRA